MQGQPAGKEEDSETSDENEPLPPDGRSEDSLLERRAVKTLAARHNPKTSLGKFLMVVQMRALPLVEDVEVDGALVAYSNDCSVQGVQHHNGSQHLVAMMERWPSFSRYGSSKLPMNHPHVAVFIFILRVTYMRPSELLTLRKKALVPPLVPLLPCCSIVIAGHEMGGFARTGVRDGSVLKDQRWVQWVNKLSPQLKCGNPCCSEIVQDGNRRFWFMRHDCTKHATEPKRGQWHHSPSPASKTSWKHSRDA